MQELTFEQVDVVNGGGLPFVVWVLGVAIADAGLNVAFNKYVESL